MKIFFEKYPLDSDDNGDFKLGLGWYRHSRNHAWSGFTFVFAFIYWKITLTYVSDFKEYDRRINKRPRFSV